ncbi:hypothetical protein [Sorangium cellulosum]|uniref:hypothetical protein n=1 Tax=Sorangium cellulosum TaxID=56 RepID=UPI001F27B9E5|nr:hypothetical protein [Sorangium cellulosum]
MLSRSGARSARAWRWTRAAALLALALPTVSCASADPVDGEPDTLAESVGEGAQALTFAIDPRKSLSVTDTDIVAEFALEDVLQHFIDQTNDPGLTPTLLFKQMFDTYRKQSEGLSPSLGPHCDDVPNSTPPLPEPDGLAEPFDGSINGWPVMCSRLVGNEASRDPFAPPPDDSAAYMATTLVNRFDLADPEGADCGEYRIVFARRSGITDTGARNLFIFEARLPNPTPSQGREGCRDVVEFWHGLSDPALTVQDRATALKTFYFDGLPGFAPVFDIDNYAAGSGQIRVNDFLRIQAPQDDWALREFKLSNTCAGGTCNLLVVPTHIDDNPAMQLFDPTSTDARAVSFRSWFVDNAVESLASSGDFNRFDYPTLVPTPFGAGEATLITDHNNYRLALGSSPSTFRSNIQQKLTAIGSPLTPDQLLARAQSISCSGCHLVKTSGAGSNNDVGLSSSIPDNSLTFTHTSEQTEPVPEDPTRTRFVLSNLVTDVFLPFRQKVMSDFLDGNPILGFEKSGAWTSSQATLSLTTGWVTEGIRSLRIKTPNAWNQVTSAPFSTAALAPVGNKLTFDFFNSPVQPNPSWPGTLTVMLSIPSRGIHSQHIGSLNLNTLTQNTFSPVTFTLAAPNVAALNATPKPSDVSLTIELNVNGGSGPYYVDNIRFTN